jgi:16S rRNA (guanine(966)-N(2))-methyltransferase RsmD
MTAKPARATGKPTRAPRHQGKQSHEIRIIGGQWKRIKLKVTDKPGLRPTPDRVRETLFNWLGQDLVGRRCVDAFAGTGALGFEAASRGAREVLLVEQDPALVVQLERAHAGLLALELPEPVEQTLRIVRGEGVNALRQLMPLSQDVVFLDPPFDADLYEAALTCAASALALDGSIYLESPTVWTDSRLARFGLRVHRHLKAGTVHAQLLRAVGSTA